MTVAPPRSYDLMDHDIPPWQSREARKFQTDHTIKPTLPYSYHKSLVRNSSMPIMESESLYDVFKCLVTTPISPEVAQVEQGGPNPDEEDEEDPSPHSWVPSRILRMRSDISSMIFGGQREHHASHITDIDRVIDQVTNEDIADEIWGAVSKDSFIELFPSVYSSDDFLADFFFSIYDQNGDGLVDFGEFVRAHITLTYSSDVDKVALAVKLLATTEFKPGTNSYRFCTLGRPGNTEVDLAHFISVLRRLLYSYYDMSRYIFADASQLQKQQLEDEKGFVGKQGVSPNLTSDVLSYERDKMILDPRFPGLDHWVWSPQKAKWTDTRLNYDPLSKDIAIEANVNNFHLEQVENSIKLFRDEFSEVKSLNSLVHVERISSVLNRNPAISSALIACVEASLI